MTDEPAVPTNRELDYWHKRAVELENQLSSLKNGRLQSIASEYRASRGSLRQRLNLIAKLPRYLRPRSQVSVQRKFVDPDHNMVAEIRSINAQHDPPLIPERHMPISDSLIGQPDLRVAAILDDFSFHAFRYECSLIETTPTNWRDILDQSPDFLFVESAWQGLNGCWSQKIAGLDGPSAELCELVNAFKDAGIPTVFWNKEDPVSYNLFIEAAKLFDWVFTTDESCIPDYQDDLGHQQVAVLPFAAQPRIHNPTWVGERSGNVAFAGTYYAQKHPHRKIQMFEIVDPARPFGLDIFSRVTGNPDYEFPFPMSKHVAGSLTYPETLISYKKYKVHLNVNSVTGSASMCSRRIFELLASGTPVVSGISPAISKVVGPGVVWEASDPEETVSLIANLLDNAELRAETALRGLRNVYRSHTYRHRLKTILDAINVSSTAALERSVSVVVDASNYRPASTLFTNLASQSIAPLELLIVGNTDAADPVLEDLRHHELDDVPIVRVEEDEIKRLLCSSSGDLLLMADWACSYGNHFLEDLLQASMFFSADLYGRVEFADVASQEPQPEGHDFLHYRPVTALTRGSWAVHRSVLQRLVLRGDSGSVFDIDTRLSDTLVLFASHALEFGSQDVG